MHNRTALTLATLATFAAPTLAQTVRTVDDDGPADHADIQAAIDAAGDGDILLVRSGSYPAFTIDGLGVAIEGEGTVLITGNPGRVDVLNLAAGQHVSLRGLTFAGTGVNWQILPDEPYALHGRDCAGTIWIEDCDVTAQTHPFNASGCGGAFFLNCASVVATGSQFVGMDATDGSDSWNNGIRLQSANLALYDSVVHAGGGEDHDDFADSSYPWGPWGGHGLFLLGSSSVFASGSEIRGGDGGDGLSATFDDSWDCNPGGRGGDGIRMSVLSDSVELLGTLVVEGAGGAGGTDEFPVQTCHDGSDGKALGGPLTGLTEHAGSARSLAFASPVREGETFAASWSGAPGDVVYLTIGLGPIASTPIPGVVGPWNVAAPFVFARFLGVIDATGTGGITPTLNDLGLPGLEIYGQALFFDLATPETHAGAATRAVLLGPGL